MFKNQMTKNEIRRMGHFPICNICGKEINENASFECVKIRRGRFVNYYFMHTECIERGYHGKKKEESEEI